MLEFEVAVEETVMRRTMRRISAPTPFAARRIVETMNGDRDEEVIEKTETILDRIVSDRVRGVGPGSAHFRKIPPCQNKDLAKSCERIELGDLRIDPKTLSVQWKGRDIRMTSRSFRMVLQLAMNPGWATERDCLLDIRTPDGDDLMDRNIDSMVKRIRKDFRKVDPEFDHIETVYGVGYRWVDDTCLFAGQGPIGELRRNQEGKPLLEVDFDRMLVSLGGYILPCSASQVRLFIFMARTPGRMLSNEEICAIVRKNNHVNLNRDGTARTAIKKIRRLAELVCPDMDIFDHLYGTGTRITSEVEVVRLKR